MASAKDNQFYLGNPNLPTPGATFNYEEHPEWVEDLEKCRKNILYFAENFFWIVNLDEGKTQIKLRPYQKRILRALRDNRFIIMLASRQASKTTLMTIYALWAACFFDDQRILIVANREATAAGIFKRVRVAYEQLPNYLKPGTVEYGKTSLALGNGSSIGISTTSTGSGRGESVNVLIVDEMAHIENGIMQEFWESVYPVISSSKKSKIFVASTPRGAGNLFHSLYEGAVKNDNDWHPERVDWWEVPGRDEAWKIKTIKTLGSESAFNQEFGCEFQQAGESAINEELFKKLVSESRAPLYVFEDGKYLLWDKFKPDHLYAAGVDVSEGVGENASVIQVIDITDLKDIQQVAIYKNKNINPLQFIPKCHEILQHWGSPPVLIERNNCGGQVVDQLKTTLEYPSVVNYGPGAAGTSYNRNGIMAHTNTKYKGVMNMRYYINELTVVKLRDVDTINELRGFIRHANGTWSARPGANSLDDTVMSLVWALMILDSDIVENYFNVVQVDDNKKPLLLEAFNNGAVRKYIDPLKTLGVSQDTDNTGGVMPFLFNDFGGSSELEVFSRQQDVAAQVDKEDLDRNGWKPLNTY